MKELLVNVFYDINFNSLKLNNKTTEILDISGNFIHDFKKLDISDLPDYNDIYKVSLQEFVTVAANLSVKKLGKKTVRNFLFFGFPIYWLTDISLKHPHLHFLLNLIIFKNTVIKHPELFRKFDKITVLAHKNTTFTAHFLKNLPINFFYHPICTKKGKRKFKILKSVLRNSLNVLRQKKIKENNTVSDYLIIYPNNMTNYSKTFFTQISEIVKTADKKLFSLPYFPFMKSNNFGNLNVSIKLSIFDVFKITARILTLKFSVFFFALFSNKPETFFLKAELNNVFESKLHLFFMYFGLKKFSKKIKHPLKVFYEDEFYETGRVISKAFSENNFITTFGIQHAAFLPEHTVYTITDTEITGLKKDNGLPIPDKFIVWGNYFKNIFLKNNSLDERYVIPAGNLTYIYNSKMPAENNKTNRILYCLTTENIFKKEIPIIQNLSEITKDYTPVFRFHPLWKFDTEIIKQSLGIRTVNISQEKNIKDDIIKSDIIITSAHSSVFLDAVVYKKPVLRLITKSDSLPNNLFGIYNCKTNFDFSTCFQKINSCYIPENKNFGLLNLNNNTWNSLFRK